MQQHDPHVLIVRRLVLPIPPDTPVQAALNESARRALSSTLCERLLREFSVWGPVESVRVDVQRKLAHVKYAWRAAAVRMTIFRYPHTFVW